jgi:hypothetical protein
MKSYIFWAGNAQLVLVQIFPHLASRRGVELGEHPLVLQLQLFGQGAVGDGEVHHHEAAGVPELVGKVAHGLAALHIEAHVVSGGVAGDDVEAQGVRAELVDHLYGVHAVSGGLGHLLALGVADKAVDEHGVEGRLLHLLAGGEYHLATQKKMMS